jgi:Holliday junction DNA helicase RuvB
VRDYAQVQGRRHHHALIADAAMADAQGRCGRFRCARPAHAGAIIENFDGGPVGVESLAAALSEERGTLEDVIEPYLIQQGFLVRTARGRMASAKAYRHLGLTPRHAAPAGLFDENEPE